MSWSSVDPYPCRYRLTEYLAGSPRTLPRVFDTVEDATDAAQVMFDHIDPPRRPQRILIFDLASGRIVRTLDGYDPLLDGPFE